MRPSGMHPGIFGSVEGLVARSEGVPLAGSAMPGRRVGLRRTFYAVLGMVLSRSAVLAGWQCRQGVELGLVQGDVGRGGVGGDLLCSFGADDRRGDRRAG